MSEHEATGWAALFGIAPTMTEAQFLGTASEYASAANVVESFRQQNPMNGDGSNCTIDRILTALVGPDERDRLKREHQDRWNAEHIEFRARMDDQTAARRDDATRGNDENA